MDKTKISVIVPCYNIEAYIEKTVQSILAQTYTNLEVILVDDGSTDGTSAIIDRLEQENACIRAFHKENGGVSSARLCGIEHASGDWIAFADGDDLLKPEMYAVLINNAIQYGVDISHCGYEMIFPDHVDQYYGTGKLIQQNNSEGLRDLLTGEFIEPSLANKLYKKELVLNAYEECIAARDIHNMEDLLWNYYFFKGALKSVFVDECFYQYILRKGSAATSQISRRKVLDPLKVFRRIEKDPCCRGPLKDIIKNRETAKLISLATMKTGSGPKWVDYYAGKARRVVKRNLFNYWRGDYSMRLKMMALLVSVSPELYTNVHEVYAKLRGTDRKYEI